MAVSCASPSICLISATRRIASIRARFGYRAIGLGYGGIRFLPAHSAEFDAVDELTGKARAASSIVPSMSVRQADRTESSRLLPLVL
jgi:hypothetical protein